MPFRPYLCLVALLGVCFAGTANADARIEDFFGSYRGFGFATDRSGPFIRIELDFLLAIGPLEGGGFEIAWSTVKRKGSNPNSMVAEVSEHRARFRPSDKPGVFLGDDRGTVFGAGPITWARLQRNLLVVYRMEVDENGVAELHVYQRMLTAKGLELFFTAPRDNIEIRSVRGRYRTQ
jgi:hypothetical protein